MEISVLIVRITEDQQSELFNDLERLMLKKEHHEEE